MGLLDYIKSKKYTDLQLGVLNADFTAHKAETVSVKNYGAIGDGISHPLSSVYSTLTLAQIKYPCANDLANQIDWCAIQTAVNANPCVYIPAGSYFISEPIQLTGANKSIIGHGIGDTRLTAYMDFAARTKNGHTVAALIWYETATGQYNSGTPWDNGGTISNLVLDCQLRCEGIHFNRVVEPQVVRDVYIYAPTTGIDCSYSCWVHLYDNVYINGASQYGIRLFGACNGTTLNHCVLYEGDHTTPTQLYVGGDSYGISVNGGVIEGCDVGIRVHNRAQISVHGVDFEVCRLVFIESIGTSEAPNPPSVVSGNTFVGTPSQAGIVVSYGIMNVESNNFYTLTAGAVPCLQGDIGGKVYAVGVEIPCISESNNDFAAWGAKTSGLVFTRLNSINSGSTSVSKLLVGDRSKRLTEAQSYNVELIGNAKADTIFGGKQPVLATDTTILEILSLGDYTKAANLDDYIANHKDFCMSAIRFLANCQDPGTGVTFGKILISASATNSGGKYVENETGFVCNTFTTSVEPVVDNQNSLGSPSLRWKEVNTINGVILDDKTNGKKYRITCTNGVLGTSEVT